MTTAHPPDKLLRSLLSWVRCAAALTAKRMGLDDPAFEYVPTGSEGQCLPDPIICDVLGCRVWRARVRPNHYFVRQSFTECYENCCWYIINLNLPHCWGRGDVGCENRPPPPPLPTADLFSIGAAAACGDLAKLGSEGTVVGRITSIEGGIIEFTTPNGSILRAGRCHIRLYLTPKEQERLARYEKGVPCCMPLYRGKLEGREIWLLN